MSELQKRQCRENTVYSALVRAIAADKLPQILPDKMADMVRPADLSPAEELSVGLIIKKFV